jgi:hypothetical protein
MCKYTALKLPSGNGSALVTSNIRAFICSHFSLQSYLVCQQQTFFLLIEELPWDLSKLKASLKDAHLNRRKSRREK